MKVRIEAVRTLLGAASHGMDFADEVLEGDVIELAELRVGG
jgi:hypothetical protein